jgi:1,4-dihydroxy-2-naphthoyl-CoA hydrolase
MSESIWKKEISLSLLNVKGAESMSERIGIRFVDIGEDYLVASMPVDERTRQPLGLLHGGASAALIETLGSVGATWSVGPDEFCVGVEINANHVRSARSGTVFGTAKPIHRGSRIHVWQVDIRTDDGKMISTGRITLAVMTKKPDQKG